MIYFQLLRTLLLTVAHTNKRYAFLTVLMQAERYASNFASQLNMKCATDDELQLNQTYVHLTPNEPSISCKDWMLFRTSISI